MSKIIKTQRFGEATALYTGTGSLSIHELKDNKFAVVRTLPCGDDPYPHIYGRFDTLIKAEECFSKVLPSVAARFNQ